MKKFLTSLVVAVSMMVVTTPANAQEVAAQKQRAESMRFPAEEAMMVVFPAPIPLQKIAELIKENLNVGELVGLAEGPQCIVVLCNHTNGAASLMMLYLTPDRRSVGRLGIIKLPSSEPKENVVTT